ncbi:MAG: hypothetical protein FWD88_04935 [Treponema sp.]|nr:hypothetical protein [Treponema sp.]
MKTTAKLFAVLLPLAMVLAGCATARVAAPAVDDTPWNTDGWVTVFRSITDVDGTVHFHVGGGGPGFLEIRGIFVNDSATKEGATVLFDFTYDPAASAGHFWWVNPELLGNVGNAGTADGRFVLASNGDDYRYGGGFGTPLLDGNAYIGFVIRTGDGGNARFAFGGYPGHTVVPFRDLVD